MSLRDFSVYIHVPFCAQKCPYCDFNTYATNVIPEQEYVESLLAELQWHASNTVQRGREVATVFFGGGTPSLLASASIAKIIDAIHQLFGIKAGAEISMEANPTSVSSDTYRALLGAGINRVSFGVQSFDDAHLARLGRDHSAEQAKKAIMIAHDVGILRTSVDLMFGVPEQTVEALERDIAIATSLPITHLSAYALSIEPGTPFFQRRERGLLILPVEGEVVKMLDALPDLLSAKGFTRYEISNYAVPGYESAHNTVYWEGGDYLGLGAGAHSFFVSDTDSNVGAVRSSNVALPATYMKSVSDGRMVSWRERLDEDALCYEFFYLGLRMMKGVSYRDFCERFTPDKWSAYEPAISDLIQGGLLQRSGDRVSLTKRGIAISDSVFEQLIVDKGNID